MDALDALNPVDALSGYWPSPWPGEDGGPARRQTPVSGAGLGIQPGDTLTVTSRQALVATMVVLRNPGEVYLLRHTAGDDAVSWVERIHPDTLDVIERSPDLPGGPTWPGGMAVHANGSLYVAFGNHAHRLAADCTLLASCELPRTKPYNSFVIVPDGHLVLKDFAGSRRGGPTWGADSEPSELLVLEPESLLIVSRLELPEPSIARISAVGDDIYVVGDTSLLRVRWTGTDLILDGDFTARYRTMPGQTYGWDAVVDAGAAWFLDNGDGSEGYIGTFVGQGVSSAPLHLVRVDLSTSAVSLTEICGLPNGVIANPPAIDPVRHIAVGYDSGNAVVAAFRFDESGATTPLWSLNLSHACHPLRYADTGELLLCDHDASRSADQLVVLDIETGVERARVDTGSPIQSPLFPAVGFGRDIYTVSPMTVTHITVA